MKITLRQLQLFVAIVETESLSQGAVRVCVSQPAASLALTTLERQLGRQLFDRVGKRLVLNENGVQFYPKASAVIEEAQKAEDAFGPNKKSPRGVIRVGMSMTIGDYIAPAYLANFMRQYSDVHILQTVANSEMIVQALEKFQLDIGFIEGETDSVALEITPWKSDEMTVFSAPNHPLAYKKQVTKSDLEAADWVMRERGSGTRAILEKYLQPKNIRMELGSITALKNMVRAGEVIGCLSEATLQQELKDKQLIKLNIKNLVMTRNFYRVVHREKYLGEALRLFIEVFG